MIFKCKYFKIKELVSPLVYRKFGDFAWKFFDEDVLSDLDTIREYHAASIVINDWAWGGSLKQCGLRCNKDDLVISKKDVYCSAHIMAKGFDLHSGNIPKLYNDVEFLIKNKRLKKIRRIESQQTTKNAWCHVDTLQANTIPEIFFA